MCKENKNPTGRQVYVFEMNLFSGCGAYSSHFTKTDIAIHLSATYDTKNDALISYTEMKGRRNRDEEERKRGTREE